MTLLNIFFDVAMAKQTTVYWKYADIAKTFILFEHLYFILHVRMAYVLFCSVLQPSSIRGLATPWTYFLHLSLSSIILTDSSTGSPVEVLMLSIQAVCGLPRLRAPGIVPCIGDAENARPENDGQRKLWVWKKQEWKMRDKNYGVWKMQDWKMTDKLLANYEHNYGVWKMQNWKMTDTRTSSTS